MMYYTYAHIRPDTGSFFYIGKRQKKRAFVKKGRGKHWQNVVKKNNGVFEVKVLNWFNNEEDAYESEIWQIAQLKPLESLVNETPGGDAPPKMVGALNPQKKKAGTPEIKESARKAAATRKRNGLNFEGDSNSMRRPEVAAKVAATMKNKKENHHSKNPEVRAKMSATQRSLGENHPSRQLENKIKNSLGNKRRWAAVSDSERKEFGRKISERMNARTGEEKRIIANKKSVSIKASLAQRTQAQKDIQFYKISKPVINLDTGETFPSATSAALFYGMNRHDNIANSCRHTAKGKQRRTGQNKHCFAFIEKQESK